MFEIDLYDGIPEALEVIGDTGARLFVATSKPQVYATRIIEYFGIGGYFESVFGSELDGVRSDKTELLAYALSMTGIDAATAAMIGDRSHDIIGARNNGLRAVGVLYGYGDEAELRDAGADEIVATVSGLPAIMLT